LLGSNLPLPASMVSRVSAVSAKEMIREFEKSTGVGNWDGISDAFDNVRKLVDGDKSLVATDTYEAYRRVKVRVLSRVSLVSAKRSWAFFCLTSGMLGAPRWIFLPSFNANPITELDSVVDKLRESLDESIENIAMDEKAGMVLHTFLGLVAKMERSLLSRKKQRALKEMQLVLESYIKTAARESNQDEVDYFDQILKMLTISDSDHQPDWDEVAARWLDIIRPIWYEELTQPRSKPLLLKDIRKKLILAKDSLQPEIIEHFKYFPVQKQTDKRILACIIGVA